MQFPVISVQVRASADVCNCYILKKKHLVYIEGREDFTNIHNLDIKKISRLRTMWGLN